MKSMLPGASHGPTATKSLPQGKGPTLIFTQYTPEMSWSMTTVWPKVARFPQQLFWAEQILWAATRSHKLLQPCPQPYCKSEKVV